MQRRRDERTIYGNTSHTFNVQSSVSDINTFAEPKLSKTIECKTCQHNMGPTHADIIAMLVESKIDYGSRTETQGNAILFYGFYSHRKSRQKDVVSSEEYKRKRKRAWVSYDIFNINGMQIKNA
ncbi:hypothetical protein DPMN_113614 [Dreissena polymorpha]|uniref:Uncharacterized protein n=1 Tax=Dreissena polymorpha TaxID=45954 RepID=A0A9D4KHQ8_DREPO|nr:hypothetical protein DPMN_113614 [Dreissena polymorpha]